MNVYDFDGTIYQGDSTFNFYLFCLKKHPKLFFNIPKQVWYITLYLFGKYDKTAYKEHFYSFLGKLENVDTDIEHFWKEQRKKIKNFYLKQQKEDDVIVSASPEFLLQPICKQLGITHLIASIIDKKTGTSIGINCHDDEKVRRFQEIYPTQRIENFYSDSLSDTPLAQTATHAYMVKKETLLKWENYTPSLIDKIKNMFFSKSFILFLFVGCVNTINGILFAYLYSLIIANANFAFIVGYVTSLTISYVLNSFITFKEKLTFNKYVKFCISYIPNFVIQNIIVLIVYNIMHLPKLLAYILAAIIGLPITFLLMNVFAFKKEKQSQVI